MALPPIQQTSQDRIDFIKVLGYGESGVGKTQLCGTAPAPLVLSVEKGLLCLRGRNINYMEINSYNELMEVYNWLNQSQEPRQYVQTLCLDSITEILELVLIKEKEENKDGRAAFGETLQNGKALVRMFRNLPYHVYMTALMAKVHDAVTGITLFGPEAPGKKLGPWLPSAFDEVFKIGVGRKQDGQSFRYVQTVADMQSVAKDRSNRLAPSETPDLSQIFAKIMA